MKAGCVPALASCTGLLPLAYCITALATDALSFQLAPGIGTRRCRRQPKVSSSTLQQVVRFNDRIGAVSCSDRSRDGGYPAAALQQQWRQAAKGDGPPSQREGGLLVCCPSAADGRIAGPDGSLSARSTFPNRPPPSSSSTAAKDSPRAVRREDDEPVLGGGKGGVFGWDGYIYSRWEQQQQQQQQDRGVVVATCRASGGRVKEEVWRKGSQRSWSPRMHTAVRINGGGSASGGSGRNRPASLPSPPRTHRRLHSTEQSQQHASIRCLRYHSSNGGSHGRRGTALSMATSTGGSGADSSFPSRGRGGTKRPAGEESPAARPAERHSACESTASAISADELASPPPPGQAAVTMEDPNSGSTTAVGEGIDATPGLPAAPAQPRKEVLANKSTALMQEQDGQGGSNLETSGEGGGDFAEEDFDGPIAESYARGRWLLGLLVLQSSSSFVLDHYQDLLREHVVVTLFLTMLVGAGGNAGNQSAIKVIRGLATGRFTPHAACALRVIGDQAIVGFLLGTALAAGGFVRVWVTEGTTLRDASAISSSLFLIVMASVLLGSALPFGFARAGVDPANAGTTIQVAMDIVGVAVTCVTCSLVLTQLDQVLTLPL